MIIYYAVICAIVYFIQDRLLYHPRQMSIDETMAAALRHGLTPWPANDAGYHGFVREPPGPTVEGTVIVFHGNAGTAIDRDFYGDALCALGFRVLLVEYPAYGARPGIVGEESFVSSAKESIELAGERFGRPLYVMGESLGAAVGGVAAANANVEIDGVVAITPWCNLPDLAQATYWYLPAKWLVRDQYDTLASLNLLGQRVAVCIAENDSIISAIHGEQLYESLTVEKRKWIFSGAGHNSWPTLPGDAWWAEVMKFLAMDKPQLLP